MGEKSTRHDKATALPTKVNAIACQSQTKKVKDSPIMLTLIKSDSQTTTLNAIVTIEKTPNGWEVIVNGQNPIHVEEYPVWGLEGKQHREMTVEHGKANDDKAYVLTATNEAFPSLDTAVSIAIARRLLNPDNATMPDYF
jgi:hypothetical protein